MDSVSLGWVIEAGSRAFLLLALAVALGAFVRRAPAHARHLWWSSALAGALVMAPLSPIVPSWRLPLLPSLGTAPTGPRATGASGQASAPASGAERAAALLEPVAARALPGTRSLTSRRRPSLAGLAIGLWAIGSAGTIGWLLCGLGRARSLARRARRAESPSWVSLRGDLEERVGLRREITLLTSAEVDTPVTWGWLRPVVLMPSESEAWCPLRRRLALAHEMAHVRRKDWLSQMLAHLACSVYWFIPMAWMARQRMRLESEKACDESVVELGIRPSEYASHLLEMSESVQPGPLAAVATLTTRHRSHVEARIMSILSFKRPIPRNRLVLAAALAGMAMLIGSVSSVSPWAEPGRPEDGAPKGRPAPQRHETPTAPEAAAEPSAQDAVEPEPEILAEAAAAAMAEVAPDMEAYEEAYQEAIAAATAAAGDEHDRWITWTDGDTQFSIRIHGTVDLDGEGRITSMEPDASVVMEAVTGEHQLRLEVTQPEGGARLHEWTVNDRSKPFDEAASHWMTTMLAVGMATDRSHMLLTGAEHMALLGALEGKEWLLAPKEPAPSAQDMVLEKLDRMRDQESSLREGIAELRAHQEALRGAAAGMREQIESQLRIRGKVQGSAPEEGSRASEEGARALEDQLRQLENLLNTTVEHQVREMERVLESLQPQQEQLERKMQLIHDQELLPLKEKMLELQQLHERAYREAMEGPQDERARRLSEELQALTERIARGAGMEL